MASPHRTVHWPSGIEQDVPAWYDYYTRRDGEDKHDNINVRQLTAQTARLVAVVKREMRHILPNKIIVGGCSQGATVVMHACATGLLKHIGGIMSLRGCFMHSLVSTPVVTDAHILVFAGSDDTVYSLSLQRESFAFLEKYGARIQWVVKHGLKHHSPSSSEITAIVQFISSVL